MAAAKAKKQRMLQIEEEKKKLVPLSEIQQEEKLVKVKNINLLTNKNIKKDSLLSRA